MKPKVLVTYEIPEKALEYISKYCECVVWEKEKPISRDELLKQIEDVEGLLTSKDHIDQELLGVAQNLKVVSNAAVGYDNFDIDALKEHRVLATHTPTVLDETVADLVFGLVLSTARRIVELNNYVKDGCWSKKDKENLFGLDVNGATMGIIGMGRIGEKIARRAKFGFNMDVLYYNRSRKYDVENEFGVEFSELDVLMKHSDFVVVMTPLTDETYHLIGEREFRFMKETAIFINGSRGQVVDETALIEALQKERIGGAGLDVFEKEPIEKDNLLLTMDNVITLPHIGSATKKTRFEMGMLAAENLVSGVLGQKPKTVVKELTDLLPQE